MNTTQFHPATLIDYGCMTPNERYHFVVAELRGLARNARQDPAYGNFELLRRAFETARDAKPAE